MSMVDQRRAYENARQMQMVRAAAQRQARYLKDVQSDLARLAIADKARSEGDIDAACRLYLRIANSRSVTPAKPQAENRLVELSDEAKAKLTDMEGRLSDLRQVSASEQSLEEATRQLMDCIADYDAMTDQYGRVPRIGKEMKAQLAKEKRRPQVQAGLREPEAAKLWQQGQELEKEGHVCCAFLIYERALKQLPAPSARFAEQRLQELRADPQQVAAAEQCRTLQWCHRQYRLAERLAAVEPSKARQLFQQIVERAPADSKVYEEALREIDRL